MTNTTALLPCAPNLSAMPAEILQHIFWDSLELSLCLVSKRMYQTLPGYTRLARFLPLLAYGSSFVTDKIVKMGGNCSDVVSKLEVATPLSDYDRVMLQQTIDASGWFDLCNIVEVSEVVAEYLIEHFWIDKGMIIEPHSKEAFETWRHNKTDFLVIDGRYQEGRRCSMLFMGFEIRIIHHWEDTGPGARHHVSFRDRFDHSTPTFSTLWHELIFLSRRYAETGFSRPFVASPQAVEDALLEAVSTKDSCVIEALTYIPITGDPNGDENTLLRPVKAEHFIAGAQSFDDATIELLCTHGCNAFSSEDDDVITWMRHAEAEAQGLRCNQSAFIHYLQYLKRQRIEEQVPVSYLQWAHFSNHRCRYNVEGQQ